MDLLAISLAANFVLMSALSAIGTYLYARRRLRVDRAQGTMAAIGAFWGMLGSLFGLAGFLH